MPVKFSSLPYMVFLPPCRSFSSFPLQAEGDGWTGQMPPMYLLSLHDKSPSSSYLITFFFGVSFWVLSHLFFTLERLLRA